jgi:CDP-diglyceride synthetase
MNKSDQPIKNLDFKHESKPEHKVTIHLEFNEADVGLFESFTLFIAAIGLLEIGFTYMTGFILILCAVAYHEMLQLKIKRTKEMNIQIKSAWVEWYFYFCFTFLTSCKLVTKLDILNKAATDDRIRMVLDHHSTISFCLFIAGAICFVLSLEEGFFLYQFKMLGWSLLSLFTIVSGGTGWLMGMWSCRMWFFFPATAMCVHNFADYLICKYFPWRTKMTLLKPSATWQGFIGSVLATFAYFWTVSSLH